MRDNSIQSLVIEFKKIESDDATKYSIFYSNSGAENSSQYVVILMMYLNQSIARLYQTSKYLLEKFGSGLLIPS